MSLEFYAIFYKIRQTVVSNLSSYVEMDKKAIKSHELYRALVRANCLRTVLSPLLLQESDCNSGQRHYCSGCRFRTV